MVGFALANRYDWIQRRFLDFGRFLGVGAKKNCFRAPVRKFVVGFVECPLLVDANVVGAFMLALAMRLWCEYSRWNYSVRLAYMGLAPLNSHF